MVTSPGLSIDLTGKTALITGGSGELGRVMVRVLAQAGADIVIHYFQNRDRAVQLADEIEQLGRRSFVVQADVTDSLQVIKMRDLVIQNFDAPNILVNNAVVQYPWRPILEQPLEDFESQFRSSVMHTVLMAKAFAPAMMERGSGRIIAINTECAMQCHAGQGAYVSGKRGLDGVMRVLARELGPFGITVNQVAPGWTISDQSRKSGASDGGVYQATVPLRRRGEDIEIAYAVAFLASELAAFIHGVYLPVCGGNVMPAI